MEAGPIEILVKPAQSAFFAGEVLTCEITFRNTRQPVRPAQVPKSATRAKHNNKSYSIALDRSAPPSKDAFSPVDSRFPPKTAPIREQILPKSSARKGLIGSPVLSSSGGSLASPIGLHYPEKHADRNTGHKKAQYSVALPSSDFEVQDMSSQQAAYILSQKTQAINLLQDDDDSAPYNSSRSVSMASNPSLAAPYANELDSASESQNFYALTTNESLDSVLRDSVTAYSNAQARPTLQNKRANAAYSPVAKKAFEQRSTSNLNPSLSTSASSQQDLSLWKNRFNPNAQGTETLIWAFAQFEGSFSVDETLIKPAEFTAVKQQLFGGGTGRDGRPIYTGAAVGGGMLDSRSTQDASSWTSWIFGGSGPTINSDGTTMLSEGPTITDNVADIGAGTLEEKRKRAMNDKNIPVFSSPPSILAVDLQLEPGETKRYSFSIALPGDLPPSYRGKSIKFTYNLLVGTNRSPSVLLGESQQQSRILKVPIRIYNNVNISGSRPFYDLTNPIIWLKDEATVISVDDNRVIHRSRRKSTGRADFEAYATNLLQSIYSDEGKPQSLLSPSAPIPIPIMSPISDDGPINRPEMRDRTTSRGYLDQLLAVAMENPIKSNATDDEEHMSCKGAVEFVSRAAKKVSFDIKKDGYLVASVTIAKNAYRLGETVQAMADINDGEARVIKLAARLETHELIETTISTKPAPQVRHMTGRLYAEHHEMTMDSGRVGINLAIPSGATPDFATSGVKLQWSLRFSFMVLPPANPEPSPTTITRRVSNVPIEQIPLSPNSAQNRARTFANFGAASPLSPLQHHMQIHSGNCHIMPHTWQNSEVMSDQSSYRAIPDLSFVPVMYAPMPNSPFSPLEVRKGHISSPSSPEINPRASFSSFRQTMKENTTCVLMPTKLQTVECIIPIKVYPSSTPFRPTISISSL